MKLKDHVAIITGGAQGIGAGMALRFAKEGAAVVIADINEEKSKEKSVDYNKDASQFPDTPICRVSGGAYFIKVRRPVTVSVSNCN